MKQSHFLRKLLPLLALCSITLHATASPYFDMPPSYEEATRFGATSYSEPPPSYEEATSFWATSYSEPSPRYKEASTYTIHLKPGDDKEINMNEFFRLSSEGYTSIRIKVAGTSNKGRTKPARLYPARHDYAAERTPHCRLLRQHDYDNHYRVLLDNTIYESNLSYDDAMLLIGKLVSVNSCTF